MQDCLFVGLSDSIYPILQPSHGTWLTLFWLFLQFLVVEHIHVPGFPDHFHNHFGPVRRELRKHLRLPNDPLPGPNQHPAGCLRLSPPPRFSCHFELLHQPQLPIHSVPGEVTVPQCTRVPASRRRHGGQLRECQSRLQQAQLTRGHPSILYCFGRLQNSRKEEKSLLVLRKLNLVVDSLCSYCFRLWWSPAGLWECVHKLCVSSALANIKCDEIWAPQFFDNSMANIHAHPNLLCTRFLRSSARVCIVFDSALVNKCDENSTPPFSLINAMANIIFMHTQIVSFLVAYVKWGLGHNAIFVLGCVMCAWHLLWEFDGWNIYLDFVYMWRRGKSSGSPSLIR